MKLVLGSIVCIAIDALMVRLSGSGVTLRGVNCLTLALCLAKLHQVAHHTFLVRIYIFWRKTVV